MAGRLAVTLRRSTVGTNPSARATVRALGLRRIGQTVELPDDPAVRGQVRAVRYLVEVAEVAAPAGKAATKSATRKPATKRTTTKRAATSPKKKEEAEA